MRILALAILLIGSVCVPAHGQTYGSHFPVCLQSYSLGGRSIDCSYTSLAQCNATASGRAAQRSTTREGNSIVLFAHPEKALGLCSSLRRDYRAIHAASFDEISLNGCAPIPSAVVGLDGVLFRMESAGPLKSAVPTSGGNSSRALLIIAASASC